MLYSWPSHATTCALFPPLAPTENDLCPIRSFGPHIQPLALYSLLRPPHTTTCAIFPPLAPTYNHLCPNPSFGPHIQPLVLYSLLWPPHTTTCALLPSLAPTYNHTHTQCRMIADEIHFCTLGFVPTFRAKGNLARPICHIASKDRMDTPRLAQFLHKSYTTRRNRKLIAASPLAPIVPRASLTLASPPTVLQTCSHKQSQSSSI